jgi:hypothetical protein
MLTCSCGKPDTECTGGHSRDVAPPAPALDKGMYHEGSDKPVMQSLDQLEGKIFEEYANTPIENVPSSASATPIEVAVDNIPIRGDNRMETGSQTGYAVSGVGPWGYGVMPSTQPVTDGFQITQAAILSHFTRDSIERRQDVAELRAALIASQGKVDALFTAFQVAEASRLSRELAASEQKNLILELVKAVTPPSNGGA